MMENISLRNYFAASALQGMIAEPSLKATPNEFAIKAYELADAMIRCSYPEVAEYKKDIVIQKKSNLLKLKEVMAYVKKSRSSIYLDVKNGTFPKPLRLGVRKVLWNLSDIEEWIATREKTNMDMSLKNDGSYK